MKNTQRYLTIFAILIYLGSCKKNSPTEVTPDKVVPEKVVILKDSISFVVNEKQYIFTDKNTSGIANRPINIKPSLTPINGGKLAYETGGYYWYGEKDSTLYSLFFAHWSKTGKDQLAISFSKKYKDSQLQNEVSNLLRLKDNTDFFKPGKLSFAVDLEKENTMDGVSIDFNRLTTRIPGFSILVKSGLTKDIQNNSTFEITKIEKLKPDTFLIEARFEANLFDNNENLYRIKNGFLRIISGTTWPGIL